MEAPAKLLETLCDLRRITYLHTGPDWVIRQLGGSDGPWPELVVGRDIRRMLPEVAERERDITARLAEDHRFVLRWIQRPSPSGRDRFYELIAHRSTDGDGWILWLIDRSAYGRLKVRIDRYYNELIEPGSDTIPVAGRPTAVDVTR